MSQKQINFDSVGKIIFRKNRRAKNISIRIKSSAGIVVTLPYYASYKTAEKFVESKKEWIKKIAKYYKIEEKKLWVAYLSDKVLYEVAGEKYGIDALQVAEKKIHYGKNQL